MPAPLPPISLSGAQILRDGTLQRGSIGIAEGRITARPLPEVDLSGYLLLPGIIDLHGDGFEHHMAPRPSARLPMALGLASYDREAAAHGVTTAYLAQGWSWEGGPRGPDQAEAMMAALQAFRPQALTDLRLQIRAETHLTGEAERLIAAVLQHRLDYVVFNDHLAEARHMARTSPGDFSAWARKIGRHAEEMLQVVEDAARNRKSVPRSLRTLTDAFEGLGVRYGSHDDPDAETRSYYAMMGAGIAEFPTTRNAAVAARAMDNPVIMGAPNVLRGGSQAGNVSARDLVMDGLCDVLVSDYHLPALPLAAWALVDAGLLDLAKAWAMISTRPAEVLGLHDRGRLAPGLRADLIAVNACTRAIEATICDGRLVHLSGEAALRFITRAGGVVALAAE
jgi:alpha-D-ribose 1-methylphosphonate 5-triphosphate diphosphatase